MTRTTPTGKEIDFRDGNLIYEIDPQGNITYANRAFLNFTGYDKRELIGAHYSKIVDPHMPTTLFHCMQNSTCKGEIWKGYSKNLSQNGDYYWSVAHVSPKENVNEGYTVMYNPAGRMAVEDISKKYEEIYALEQKGEDTRGLIKNIIIIK
jgi:aerotaxis receptor